MLKLKLQYFGHLMRRADSLEKTLMLRNIEGRRRRDGRGWDGLMASLTQWAWIWANSGRWWRTGQHWVLQSMRLQRVGQDWTTTKKNEQMNILWWCWACVHSDMLLLKGLLKSWNFLLKIEIHKYFIWPLHIRFLNLWFLKVILFIVCSWGPCLSCLSCSAINRKELHPQCLTLPDYWLNPGWYWWLI